MNEFEEYEQTLFEALESSRFESSDARDTALSDGIAAYEKLELLFEQLCLPAGLAAKCVNLTDHPKTIGHYQIVKPLGEGGFGTVYLAYDRRLQRTVTVKLPRPERSWAASNTERWLQEAKHAAGLDHPGIVTV